MTDSAEEYDVISPTGVQTFDLWEKRGEVHGQLVVPSLHNNLENLKDNFNFHPSRCGTKNRKKIIACSFFLQLYCGKEEKRCPAFMLDVVFLWWRISSKHATKNCCTLIVFIGKTSSSTHTKKTKKINNGFIQTKHCFCYSYFHCYLSFQNKSPWK